MPEPIDLESQKILLQLARQALEQAVQGKPLQPLDLGSLPETLREPGATFVTLTIAGGLRGCIGALEAYQPLAEDVREHAVAAGLDDYRFMPVTVEELPLIQIEVSLLTTPQPLEYKTPAELIQKLRPGVDGVILMYGPARATFLPQVWDKLPDPAQFLSYLCEKMGMPRDAWRHKPLKVLTYQVQEFNE